jgi:predicted DNA-binding transcriptional regulator
MIDEIKVKEAFSRIRKEMEELRRELAAFREEFSGFKHPPIQPISPLFSIGNEGVPTNKQTNKPTHNTYPTQQYEIPTQNNNISDLVESLKTDLKRKFRSLTKQEFMVFSVLFTVEKELKIVTYKDISKRLSLSETSIRDYIMRIINKGIPLIKERVNNKTVILRIPTDLRNISTLESLMKLRNNGRSENFLDDKN